MFLNKVFLNLLPADLLVSSTEEELFKIDYIITSNNLTYESFCKYILDKNYNDKLIILLYKFILHLVDIETYDIIQELNINNEIKEKISFDISEYVYINYKNGIISYGCDKRNYLIIMKRFNYIPDKYKSKILKWFINEFSYIQSLANIS